MAIAYANTMADPDWIYRVTPGVSANYTGEGSRTMPLFSIGDPNGSYIALGNTAGAGVVITAPENGGTFHNLTLYVGTAVIGVGYTYVWEYYRAYPAAWVALDDVTDPSNGFQNAGAHTITFTPPFDWGCLLNWPTIEDVNWIRIRITGLAAIVQSGVCSTNKVQVGENVIRVTGNDDTETIEDIYAADVANGWGVVTRQGYISNYAGWVYPDWHVYWINAVLKIGLDNGNDAVAVTKYWGEVYCLRTLHITENGSLEVGTVNELDPDDDPAGARQGWFCVMDANGGITRAWQCTADGSTFAVWGGALRFGGTVQFIGGDVEWRDCVASTRVGGMQFYTDSLSLKNVIIQTFRTTSFYLDGAGTVDEVSIMGSSTYPFQFGIRDGVHALTISKLDIRYSSSYQMLPVAYEPPGGSQADGPTHFLDDCKFSDEDSVYKQGYYDIRVQHRRTFNMTLTDIDGVAIEGATVACTNKDGDTEFSVSTDANGQIAEQKIVRRWWRWGPGVNGGLASATNNEDYNPFTFTITKTGYNVLTIPSVTISGGTFTGLDWRVVLLELASNILVVVGVIDVGDMVGTVPGPVRATELVGDTRG